MKNLLFAFCVVCFVANYSCTYDQLDAPNVEFCDTIPATYELNIKTIVETNCAYPGCHISGFPSGDFSTYTEMLSRLESGSIKDRVIIQKDDPNVGMPPNYATGPKDLTPEELDIFMCWLEAGFPEN